MMGGHVPYLGYVEASLRIPGIKTFNVFCYHLRDYHTLFPSTFKILLLVIMDSRYAQCTSIQIGTFHID